MMIRLSLILSLCVLRLAPTVAHAQVSPVGSHHLTQGPGAGINPGPSPVGTMAQAVPLDLPPPRGDLPVPLSVTYTGGQRVGAAGMGWDVPISYVRLSSSVSRRKPALGGGAPPARLMLSLPGMRATMTPAAEPDVYVPLSSAQYVELRRTASGWIAWDLAGREYVFEAEPALDDPTLWLLSEIRERIGTDRVKLDYRVDADGCYKGRPQLLLQRISYTFDAADVTPLFEIELQYKTQDVVPSVPGTPLCTEDGPSESGAYQRILAVQVDEGRAQTRPREVAVASRAPGLPDRRAT